MAPRTGPRDGRPVMATVAAAPDDRGGPTPGTGGAAVGLGGHGIDQQRATSDRGGGAPALRRELRPSLLARNLPDMVASVEDRIQGSSDHHHRGGPREQADSSGAGLSQPARVGTRPSASPEVGDKRKPSFDDVAERREYRSWLCRNRKCPGTPGDRGERRATRGRRTACVANRSSRLCRRLRGAIAGPRRPDSRHSGESATHDDQE
jgi:hypothetical protein